MAQPRSVNCSSFGNARTVPGLLSLRLYLSLFSSLEFSEIRNDSSVPTAEIFLLVR